MGCEVGLTSNVGPAASETLVALAGEFLEPIATRLLSSRGEAPANAPVFESVRNPGHALTERAVNFIVKAAARRAGVNTAASVHWLRHLGWSKSHWGRLIDRSQSGGVAPGCVPFAEILVTAPITTSIDVLGQVLAAPRARFGLICSPRGLGRTGASISRSEYQLAMDSFFLLGRIRQTGIDCVRRDLDLVCQLVFLDFPSARNPL